MSGLFRNLTPGLDSRWPGSKVDISTYNSRGINFVTLSGFDGRFVQVALRAERIEIIEKVIDSDNLDNSFFEVTEIKAPGEAKFISKSSQGVEFEVVDTEM